MTKGQRVRYSTSGDPKNALASFSGREGRIVLTRELGDGTEYMVLWDGEKYGIWHIGSCIVPLKTQSSEVTDDGVRKPSHYQVFDGVESIEIIARSMTISEFRGFCMGNVLKYRLRAGKKSELATMEKDLNKAAFYQELFDLHKGKCYASE